MRGLAPAFGDLRGNVLIGAVIIGFGITRGAGTAWRFRVVVRSGPMIGV
jgi:hypothetical protein